MKMKKIVLEFTQNPDGFYRKPNEPVRPYRVASITDSVEYAPGDYLTKDEVSVLCASKEWTVTSKPM